MHKVFVYGTLLKGKGANHMLPPNGRAAETAGYYTLFDLGSFPGLDEEPMVKVKGEVYQVDDETLDFLDVYEGEGSLYHRKNIKIKTDLGEEEAYAYFISRPFGTRIESGDWREYELR